jgi:hypothetical protein
MDDSLNTFFENVVDKFNIDIDWIGRLYTVIYTEVDYDDEVREDEEEELVNDDDEEVNEKEDFEFGGEDDIFDDTEIDNVVAILKRIDNNSHENRKLALYFLDVVNNIFNSLNDSKREIITVFS